ncbi:hypothetical protein [Alienimonas californiensis]|uniref:Uncharacterized protein n=1 Tax=Alienimonas californiensis TaxID=2527989 RepID=A0A517PAJ6_9PLAN|nr:hypothetical protein [Alienimonas californiensis]QDT16381.1 hypothetical protein CA12_24830 [Alienimonas californiensis]
MKSTTTTLAAPPPPEPAASPIVDPSYDRPDPVGPDTAGAEMEFYYASSPFGVHDHELWERPRKFYNEERPVHRSVHPYPWFGGVEVYDNFAAPARHLAINEFEAAVYRAGGIVTHRSASVEEGPLKCYPHALFGRPDGDGWTVFWLISLLPEHTVRELVEKHLGPLDVPWGGVPAA